MTAEAFEAQVRRLEAWSSTAPRLYRLGVVAWAVLGYAVIFAFLLGAVAMLALLVLLVLSGHILILLKLGFKALIVLIPTIWVLLSSLFVRLPPPEGIVLQREAHGRLFALIDAVRVPLGVRAPDRVLLIHGINAAVAEYPRLGLLPWFRSYLLIGMPLLRSVSEAEFKAILAHEFGHLSGAHGRLGSWIYRVRRSWDQIVQRVAQGQGGGGGLLMRFFFWYVPRFSAWSFTLARANEYEADQTSARLTDPRTAADALLRVNIAAGAEARFHTDLDRRTQDTPQPPPDMVERLGASLRGASAATDAESWLTRALGARTDATDTHPALVDRLRALAQEPRVPPPLPEGGDAATALLGAAAATLEATLSQAWREDVGAFWSERRKKRAEMHDQLTALDARVAGGALDLPTLRSRAALISALRDEGEALAAWRVVLRLSPTDNVARYHVGHLLLQQTRCPPEEAEEALELLAAAAEQDADALVPVAEVLVPWLRTQHRDAEAQAWITRARAHLGAIEVIQAERATVSAKDTLLPAALPEAVRQAIAAQINTTDGVAGAWVAQKALTHGGPPLYVLGVLLSLTEGNTDASREAREVRWQLLADGFRAPGEWLLIPLHHHPALRKKLVALPDADLPC